MEYQYADAKKLTFYRTCDYELFQYKNRQLSREKK